MRKVKQSTRKKLKARRLRGIKSLEQGYVKGKDGIFHKRKLRPEVFEKTGASHKGIGIYKRKPKVEDTIEKDIIRENKRFKQVKGFTQDELYAGDNPVEVLNKMGVTDKIDQRFATKMYYRAGNNMEEMMEKTFKHPSLVKAGLKHPDKTTPIEMLNRREDYLKYLDEENFNRMVFHSYQSGQWELSKNATKLQVDAMRKNGVFKNKANWLQEAEVMSDITKIPNGKVKTFRGVWLDKNETITPDKFLGHSTSQEFDFAAGWGLDHIINKAPTAGKKYVIGVLENPVDNVTSLHSTYVRQTEMFVFDTKKTEVLSWTDITDVLEDLQKHY